MIRLNRAAAFVALALFFLPGASLFSAEYINGRVKLVLNEESGRFSLFYLVDLDSETFEPLFADQDPRTTFLAIQINDRTFKLGESSAFRIRLGGSTDEPEVIFDSPGITVTQKFTFIAAGNSSYANGISMAVYVVNKGERPVKAGIRFLLDTSLGEEAGGPSFITDIRPMTAETLLTSNAPDGWWVSRNSRYGLMGTINSVYVLPPASVHFANWKRLHDVNWTLPFSPRNFSNPPNSFYDAAVSYLYEAETIAPKSFRVVELLFAADTGDGFSSVSFSVTPFFFARSSRDGSGDMPSREDTIRRDLDILRNLVIQIDEYMVRDEPVPEEILAEMELLVARVQDRHGIW